ncbi:MAG: hypothetical protein JNJ90_07450 [Saprospiraceae bacterium]|nr:hypothetical protein [Saprospiraceae bacterium]
MWYQKDSIDQFIHRYAYDADNRVEFVQTSRDGLLWERDANYEYLTSQRSGKVVKIE